MTRRRARRALLWLAAALASTGVVVLATAEAPGPATLFDGWTNEPEPGSGYKINIGLRPGTAEDFAARQSLDRARLVRKAAHDYLNLHGEPTEAWFYEMPPEASLEETDALADRLREDPAALTVLSFQPLKHAGATPDDADWSAGDRQWGLRRMRPEAAWADPRVTDSGRVQVVAIDGAADARHEDLSVEALYPSQSRPDPHGTFVTGLLGATTGNGRGVASAPWGQPVLLADLHCEKCSIMDAYRAAAEVGDAPPGEQRRVVVNASVCHSESRGLFRRRRCMTRQPRDDGAADASRRSFESGRVLWVGGSGNDGRDAVGWPARYPWFVAVGSIEASGQPAPSSNWGPGLDLLAPGEEVWSTRPGNRYGRGSGTSFAAPHVAAAATAIWEHEPQLTSHQVMKRLLASGGELRSERRGHGVVDIGRAVAFDARPPSITVLPRPTATGDVAFRIEVTDDTDPVGLARIDERYRRHLGDGDAEGARFELDFGQVPTAAVAAVRWSLDGGPWQEVAVDPEAVQPWVQPDGSRCQVCAEVTVPVDRLALADRHRLVVRAWDSSTGPEGPPYGERVVDLPVPVAQGSRAVLVVDHSVSMKEAFGSGSRMEAAQRAASDVLSLLERVVENDPGAQVALVRFAGRAEPVPFTKRPASLGPAVEALRPESTGTDLGAALEAALQLLGAEPAEVARSIVLLSDGEPTEGLSGPGVLAGPVGRAREAGVRIHTVALGEKGRSLLAGVASGTGGVSSSASTSIDLREALLSAAHRSTGIVVGEGSGGDSTLRVPRGAASLRVSVLASEAVLIEPGGARRPVPVDGEVAAISIDSPAAGDYRVEGGAEGRVVASVRPAPLSAAAMQVPPDPDPPPIATAPLAPPPGPPPDPPRSFDGRRLGGGLLLLALAALCAALLLRPGRERVPASGPGPSRAGAARPTPSGHGRPRSGARPSS